MEIFCLIDRSLFQYDGLSWSFGRPTFGMRDGSDYNLPLMSHWDTVVKLKNSALNAKRNPVSWLLVTRGKSAQNSLVSTSTHPCLTVSFFEQHRRYLDISVQKFNGLRKPTGNVTLVLLPGSCNIQKAKQAKERVWALEIRNKNLKVI